MGKELRAAELDAHLSKKLEALYVIHGDEPLFAIEAADAIRTAARRSGFEEREVFIVEQHFRWDGVFAASANLGLFGARKLIDLRIPSGKPGTEGAQMLERIAQRTDADLMTLVTLPRIDRATQASAWFSALVGAGVSVNVQPLDRAALPGWIAERLARNGQRVPRNTLAFLAERCEGNLLAARQEIDKLALLLPKGELPHDDVERVVADVARYDIQELSVAWLMGDASRTLRIIDVLRAEGEPITLAVWQLGEDLHALVAVQEAMAERQSLGTAIRTVRVYGRRQQALERAVRRVRADRAERVLHDLAMLDALAKGIGRGDPWDALCGIALALCGRGLPTAWAA